MIECAQTMSATTLFSNFQFSFGFLFFFLLWLPSVVGDKQNETMLKKRNSYVRMERLTSHDSDDSCWWPYPTIENATRLQQWYYLATICDHLSSRMEYHFSNGYFTYFQMVGLVWFGWSCYTVVLLLFVFICWSFFVYFKWICILCLAAHFLF